MSKPDKNLYSFTGDKHGNIWLNELILFWGDDWTEGTRRRHTLDLRGVKVGKDISDTVKLSGVLDFNLTILGVIEGGYEDCIDINNECKRCDIIAPDGSRANGRYFSTIKGGSKAIYVMTILLSHGDATDVALGEHSDQSQRITSGITLDIEALDNRSVDYWQFNAEKPKFAGHSGPYNREIRIPSWFRKIFVKCYAFLKSIGLPI